MSRPSLTRAALAPALIAWAAIADGAGFALFEHGNRAMAMGGAFTAVADDPSALFWNPAGLALQGGWGLQVEGGVTLIRPSQDFTGASPFPGDGYTASQVDQVFPPLHLYAVMPLSERVVGALGVISPFGLGSWWEDDFAGRYVSKRGDMRTYELAPTLAVRLGSAVSLGVGLRYMAVQVDLTRDLPLINPFTQTVVPVGQVHLETDGLDNGGWGWSAGLLLELGAGFSAGVCYRSGIDVDIKHAEASFSQYSTGNPELDALVAQTLPFDENLPGLSAIDFPDLLSVGVAWTGEVVTISAQWGRMGWSSFQELPLVFPDRPDLSSTIPEEYEDSDQYRLGIEWRLDQRWAVRGGLVHDLSPQPARSMSALLADGDRTGASAGAGWTGERWRLDLAVFYLDVEERDTGRDQFDGFVGSYEGHALLAGATLGYRF